MAGASCRTSGRPTDLSRLAVVLVLVVAAATLTGCGCQDVEDEGSNIWNAGSLDYVLMLQSRDVVFFVAGLLWCLGLWLVSYLRGVHSEIAALKSELVALRSHVCDTPGECSWCGLCGCLVCERMQRVYHDQDWETCDARHVDSCLSCGSPLPCAWTGEHDERPASHSRLSAEAPPFVPGAAWHDTMEACATLQQMMRQLHIPVPVDDFDSEEDEEVQAFFCGSDVELEGTQHFFVGSEVSDHGSVAGSVDSDGWAASLFEHDLVTEQRREKQAWLDRHWAVSDWRYNEQLVEQTLTLFPLVEKHDYTTPSHPGW